MTKHLIALVVALGIAGAIYGAYLYPKADAQFAGTSTAGSSFNTAKYAGKAIVPSAPGTDATTTSILNTDANDRFITAVKVGCENVGTSLTQLTGAGLAIFQLAIGTSSATGGNPFNSPRPVGSTPLTIGTSTAFFVTASSTASNGATTPGSANVNNIWAAGSYLNFGTNATNTASCTVGVDYIPA